MRFGHLPAPDGRAVLFAEVDGRRIDVAGATLDDVLTAGSLAEIRAALERRFADGKGEAAPDEDGRLLPPVLRPGKVLAIGLNYRDHCREFGVDPPDAPIVFPKIDTSLCGHGDVVRWNPAVTAEVDWESELAVVVGRPLRDADRDEARAGIFGYTVLNDVTARDIQRAEEQWVRAKGLDGFCPIGPLLVTADEVHDPQDLAVRSRINGAPMQDSTTAEMIFPVVDLLVELSRSFTLRPGDVVATGTPLGVGAFRDPPVFLGDGDTMEMEVEGIGVLRNRCEVKG